MMSWYGIACDPQDLNPLSGEKNMQLLVELEFVKGQVTTLEDKLKSTMMSNFTLK